MAETLTLQRPEQTRARILRSAAECFARRGYDATGVAEICRRAGVSKGALYHHFSNKQALFLELLNEWLVGLDEQLAELAQTEATVPERLVSMVAAAQQVFVDARGHLPIYLEFWSRASKDADTREATIGHYRRYQAFFEQLYAAGVAEGSLRPIDVQVVAQMTVSLAMGTLLQSLLDPEGSDWGAALWQAVSLLLKGMVASTEPDLREYTASR